MNREVFFKTEHLTVKNNSILKQLKTYNILDILHLYEYQKLIMKNLFYRRDFRSNFIILKTRRKFWT